MVSYAHLLNENWPILLDFVHPTITAMLQLLQPTLKTCLLKKAWAWVAWICLREGGAGARECMKGPLGLRSGKTGEIA